MPKTCVVIVSYRGSADTENCLASLASSLVPVQVVVVDTTPSDPELGKVLERYPATKLIQAGENLGFGRGNNLGIRWALEHTECEFLFLLNNDAVVYPESVSKLEDYLDTHADISILTPRIAYRDDPDRLWYGAGQPKLTYHTVAAGHGSHRRHGSDRRHRGPGRGWRRTGELPGCLQLNLQLRQW